MTELRRRMDDDMIVRGFAARTRETYLDVVKGLAKHYHRSPDLITDAEIQGRIRRGTLRASRTTTFKPADVKAVRTKLRASQREFAIMIGVSVATLRNWEQGRRVPPTVQHWRFFRSRPRIQARLPRRCMDGAARPDSHCSANEVAWLVRRSRSNGCNPSRSRTSHRAA